MDLLNKYKKILIVSRNFYPEMSPRAYRATELAKELSRQGNKVTVCFPTNGENYSSFAIKNNVRILDLGQIKWKGVKLKGRTIEYLIRKAFNRGLLLFFEWPDIELMFKVAGKVKNEKGYDLLISIAVPHPIHWGVAMARSPKNKIADCWIADCGDPYMGDKADSFRKLFYFKYAEKWFCRKADFITIPFEGARSAYYEEFHKKIRIIPQGFRMDNIIIPAFEKIHDYPIFAYSGGFIPGKRDPEPLLRFLSQCNINFNFFIFTSQSYVILPFKRILGDKLIIREPIPREELLEALAGMDFLINFDNNISTQLPSKLIDYSITGRPVLNVTREIDESLILEFLEGNYKRKLHLEPPSNYDIRVIAEKFTRLHATF